MGLMEKTEKLAVTMEKYEAMGDGKINLELVTKEQLSDDLKLVYEIAILLATKIVQIDDEVVAWEVTSKILENSESPFFVGARATLDNNIKSVMDIMDSNL